jgi:hypothetical protein
MCDFINENVYIAQLDPTRFQQISSNLHQNDYKLSQYVSEPREEISLKNLK